MRIMVDGALLSRLPLRVRVPSSLVIIYLPKTCTKITIQNPTYLVMEYMDRIGFHILYSSHLWPESCTVKSQLSKSQTSPGFGCIGLIGFRVQGLGFIGFTGFRVQGG